MLAAAVSPNSVVIRPGSISTTFTPKPTTSKRSASLIASTAYFVAWYIPPPGNVMRPPIELMLRILPERASRIAGSTSWHIRTSPKTLVSNWRRISSPLTVSTAPDWL